MWTCGLRAVEHQWKVLCLLIHMISTAWGSSCASASFGDIFYPSPHNVSIQFYSIQFDLHSAKTIKSQGSIISLIVSAVSGSRRTDLIFHWYSAFFQVKIMQVICLPHRLFCSFHFFIIQSTFSAPFPFWQCSHRNQAMCHEYKTD